MGRNRGLSARPVILMTFLSSAAPSFGVRPVRSSRPPLAGSLDLAMQPACQNPTRRSFVAS
ncbi:hypothetical protein GQ53DRAFT_752549 [Thozetella sp. PMI_491]|nr:hypothetical protein GQ53DRAFT_752549 [Thozetella sp. PMI_491]